MSFLVIMALTRDRSGWKIFPGLASTILLERVSFGGLSGYVLISLGSRIQEQKEESGRIGSLELTGIEPTKQNGRCDSVHDMASAGTESIPSVTGQLDD
jgi:hypothetical protein